MSNLIPTISFSEFLCLDPTQMKEMKSFEVTLDGETVFFAIIPPLKGGMTITDVIKTEADYLAARGNAVGGKDPREFVED